MAAMAFWWFRGRRRKDSVLFTEPAPWSPDYFTSAVLDPRWTGSKTSIRRTVESVFRDKNGVVVATLHRQVDTLLSGGRRETIWLDTSEHFVELLARHPALMPWKLNPTSWSFTVTIDGDALGTLDVGPEDTVARGTTGDVARWQTGPRPTLPIEDTEPRWGALLGKASGSLRVPLARLNGPRDFVDHPFFAIADGDERWLHAFLALAAGQSLAIQSR